MLAIKDAGSNAQSFIVVKNKEDVCLNVKQPQIINHITEGK